MLTYGYISNGFANHSLAQMIQVLKRFGYQGIGITLDHHPLDPFHTSRSRLREVRTELESAGLRPVIETGARFYLDPYRKHRPSLVSADRDGRRQRIAYYHRAIEVAAELGASVVSLWSGAPQPGTPESSCWQRLEDSLPAVLERAEREGIDIGFEPEPGMFIESLADFAELTSRVSHRRLRMTLDIGHLAITEEPPLENALSQVMPHVVNVHVDDIRNRVHEHLPLGEGEIDFPPLLRVLNEANYDGVVLVELSRDSHRAAVQAQRSIVFLKNAERGEK